MNTKKKREMKQKTIKFNDSAHVFLYIFHLNLMFRNASYLNIRVFLLACFLHTTKGRVQLIKNGKNSSIYNTI